MALSKEEQEYFDSLKTLREVTGERIESEKVLKSTVNKLADLLKKDGAAAQQFAEATNKTSRDIEKNKLSSERTRTALGKYANTLFGVIAIGRQEIEAAQLKVKQTQNQVAVIKAAIGKQKELLETIDRELAEKKILISARQGQRAAAQNEQVAIKAQIDDKKSMIKQQQEARNAIKQQIEATKESAAYTKQSIGVAVQAKAASEQRITALKAEKEGLTSELSQTQARLSEINRFEEQYGVVSKATAEEKQRLLRTFAHLDGRLKENQDALHKENLARLDIIGAVGQLTSQLSEEEAKVKALNSEVETQTSEISKNIQEAGKLAERHKLAQDSIDAHNSALATLIPAAGQLAVKQKEAADELEDLANASEDLAQKMRAEKLAARMKKFDVVGNILSKAAEIAQKVADGLGKLIGPVRETQQKLGLSAGSAAKIQMDLLAREVKSAAAAIASGGKVVPVTVEEMRSAMEAFQEEFGGVLTTQAAEDLAQQAKQMGVSTSALAKARRVFVTQSMGDLQGAIRAQNSFVEEFKKKGLTAKDAMAAIEKNSELLARNGNRFAISFARAAADARKIGVDLSKVDQIGDNIIGDFEGFLEKTAELGAMGFNLDSQKLAEIAETGDTGALFEELRSQLAATGKDINNLRRSEQLALTEAFGVQFQDTLRMAAPRTADTASVSGEAVLPPNELDKNSNESLTKIVNTMEGTKVIAERTVDAINAVKGVLDVIQLAVAAIGTLMLVEKGGDAIRDFLGKRKKGGPGGRSRARAPRGPRGPRGPARGPGRVPTGGGRPGVLSRTGTGLRSVASRATGAASRVAGRTMGATRSIAGRGAGLLSRAGGGIRAAGRAMRGAGGLARGLGSAARVAGRFGRFIPGVGQALALGMGAYDAFRGFQADKEAPVGRRLLNAGSSVMAGLTFGLLGRDASQISEAAAARRQAAPQPAPATGAGRVSAAAAAAPVVTGATTAAAAAPTAPRAAGAQVAAAPQPAPVVNIRLEKLEAKIDQLNTQLVRAISSMDVTLDGTKVGKVISVNQQRAGTNAPFRAMSV